METRSLAADGKTTVTDRSVDRSVGRSVSVVSADGAAELRRSLPSAYSVGN